jgi:uncharacterized membrane protein YcaP (DUF421 family)
MPHLELIHTIFGGHGGAISWPQMLARTLLVFAFGLLLVRLAGKRVFGKWGALDIIVAVIIGSNLSRTLTGNAPLVETLAATALLVILHALLTHAAVHLPALGPVLKGRSALLIRDGEIDSGALRRHGVGGHDLEQALHCAGLTGPQRVKAAYLERNGEISVIRSD